MVALVSGVTNTDNFQGVSMGVPQPTTAPATTPTTWTGTGAAGPANVGFITLHLRVARTEDAGPYPVGKPLDFNDGADLDNYTN